MQHPSVTVLMTEDDPGQAFLIKQYLEETTFKAQDIVHLSDGQELLDYLCRKGTYEKRERHQAIVILLDIQMPRLDGFETLKQIKSDQRMRVLPVIMLTTSQSQAEIAHCYRLGCNAYVTKPLELNQFMQTIQRLGHFLKTAQWKTDAWE